MDPSRNDGEPNNVVNPTINLPFRDVFQEPICGDIGDGLWLGLPQYGKSSCYVNLMDYGAIS